jgi:ribulose-phosphate 3-epimerase
MSMKVKARPGLSAEIVPSILTAEMDVLTSQVEMVESFKSPPSRVGIDIIDGLYADNITVALEDVEDMDFGNLKIDYQLMVEEPIDFLGQCFQAKATRVLAQIERMGSRALFLEAAEEYPFEVGWALDLYTPIEELSDDELEAVQTILLMSVKVGFSGQAFNGAVLEKIKELRERGFGGDIVVDGGLNTETIPFCLAAGANQFCVTSAIWKESDPAVAWKELIALLKV